jgi:capsular polysaccharide transport system permease protein
VVSPGQAARLKKGRKAQDFPERTIAAARIRGGPVRTWPHPRRTIAAAPGHITRMSVDEVKQGERIRGLVDFAQRSLTELRRGAETIEPIPTKRGRALVQQARARLAWTRLPGLRPPDTRPVSYTRMLLWRFGLFVALPTAVVGLYLFVFASNQYIAEAKFAVRGNVEPMEHSNLGEFSALIQKHNSQDSYIVRDFIRSQTLVSALEKSVGLSKIFSRGEADFWARYSDPQPVEVLTKYWRRQVEAHIDAISGVIQLTVRTFTPQDSLTIAQEVITRAERLINEISSRAQADMLVQSQKDADVAQARLREAHLALQRFRNSWGIIDPVKAAESTMTTMLTLRRDKIKAENDLQVLRASNLDEKSRSIQVLVANVAAIDQQMRDLQGQLTRDVGQSGSPTMANALLEYEGLMVERTIAEKLHESASNLLDRARVSAGKQHIFLAVIEQPALPTDSLYPHRGRALFVTFFCCVLVFCSFSLILSGIRDQRV